MRDDQQLCEEYGIDMDDQQSLSDASYLESACSLAGYERITDLLEFNRIREEIDATYQRALSSENVALIPLSERAVSYHGRMTAFVQRLVEAEREQNIDSAPNAGQLASDFLDRIGRGAYAPDMVIMGLQRAAELFGDGCRPFEHEHTEMSAITAYLIGLLEWTRGIQHDVVELGYREAVIRRFEIILKDPAASEEMRLELRRRGEPTLMYYLQERGHETHFTATMHRREDNWFW